MCTNAAGNVAAGCCQLTQPGLCTAAAPSNDSTHFFVSEQLVGQHTDNMQQWLYSTDFYTLPQCYLQLLSQSLSLEGQEGILPVQYHQNVMPLQSIHQKFQPRLPRREKPISLSRGQLKASLGAKSTHTLKDSLRTVIHTSA